MDNNSFRTMYDDFFGSSLLTDESSMKKLEEVSEEINIEDLLLDEKSIELLKRIIVYMDNYNNSKTSNYINFNILFACDNKETIEKVINILKRKSGNYIKNSSATSFSFYNLDKSTDVSALYKNGIVCFKDLKAFDSQEVQDRNLFLHNLKNNINNKNITILCDNDHDIDSFLTYDNDLKNTYFTFKLVGIKPDVQDVYNEILEKVTLSEEKQLALLDYITNTYAKSLDNYVTYRDKLINYISFNEDVPKLSESKSNEEIFEELNELVGLDDVKTALKDLVSLITLKQKTEGTLKIKDINLHMLFLGNPGTGKTTVARLLSGILYNLGYIKENKLIEVSSKDLVAEYVGQTAPKTNAAIERAKGGILFIDEAYALASDNSSYNDEAIATLIKGMEDYRDDLVVILAGYTKEMQAFLNSNSGIVSRIGYTLTFKDYTVDELIEIFKSMVYKAGFKITDGALLKARHIIEDNIDTKNFGNARFVRNLYEKTVVKHATNTKERKKKDLLITITEEDINADNLIAQKD